MNELIFFKEKGDDRIGLFSALYITSLLANLAMGYRYISLGSLTQSGGIFIFPLSLILSAIITELYGSILARKLVRYGIICQFIFSMYAYLVVHLPAPEFLLKKSIYFEVFNPYLFFSCASTISIWLGSWINIKLLSKLSDYFGGGYFALRSLIATTIGEFFVTLVSMLIANYNRVEFNILVYMILCCFIVKTIISFVAIFPASVVVYKMKDQGDIDISFSIKNLKTPFSYLKRLFLTCGNAKGYKYNLEAICPYNKKALIYHKAAIELPLINLILNHQIIEYMSPTHASHIGYYYGILIDNTDERINYLNYRKNKNDSSLTRGSMNISSITRNGKLNIESKDQESPLVKSPIEIYRNESLINKFSSSQAMYIGYLAGLSNRDKQHQQKINIPVLRVIK